MPISIGFVLLLSATNSTWSNHGIVELLCWCHQTSWMHSMLPSLMVICCLSWNCLNIFLMLQWPKSYLCYYAFCGWVWYCTVYCQNAQCTCWMSNSYHYNHAFDIHSHHPCFSSFAVLGRCLTCCTVSSVYLGMKVNDGSTVQSLVCYITSSVHFYLLLINWLVYVLCLWSISMHVSIAGFSVVFLFNL